MFPPLPVQNQCRLSSSGKRCPDWCPTNRGKSYSGIHCPLIVWGTKISHLPVCCANVPKSKISVCSLYRQPLICYSEPSAVRVLMGLQQNDPILIFWGCPISKIFKHGSKIHTCSVVFLRNDYAIKGRLILRCCKRLGSSVFVHFILCFLCSYVYAVYHFFLSHQTPFATSLYLI